MKKRNNIQRAIKQGIDPATAGYMHQLAKKQTELMKAEATEDAFLCMLYVPTVISANDYWQKSAKKRIPEFVEECLKVFQDFINGMFTREEMEATLKDLAGITLTDRGVEKK